MTRNALIIGALSCFAVVKMWRPAGARDRGETQEAGWA